MDNMYAFTLLSCLFTWIYVEGAIVDMRLAGGSNPFEGRVEVNVEGIGWNTICGNSWDMNDVMVTCRQLGFSGAQLDVSTAEFGTGTAPKYKQSLLCKGNEDSLNDCSMRAASCAGGTTIAGAVCHDDLYLGCYGDDPQDRPLTGALFTNSSHMTIDYCRSFCNQRGFKYAGLELGSECYCGSESANYSAYGRYIDSNCRHLCSGNRLQACGGIARMAVHIATPPTTPIPTQPASSTNPNRSNQSAEPPSGVTTDITNPGLLPLESRKVKMMTAIVYVFAILLVICCAIIIGCVVWNCKLRSRLRKSYDVTKRDNHDNGNSINGDGNLPYMALSELHQPAEGSNYQGLSVQRRQGQLGARGRDPGAREGAYATSILLGDPVYQEPSEYMDPEDMQGFKVGLPGKPGVPEADDDLLGGGNDYEMFGS